jgi:hypothetical protein
MNALKAAVDAVMGATEEVVMSAEEGFEVTEAYEIGSRVDVKEDRLALPAAKHVLARVEKASTRMTRMTERGNPNSGSVKAINLQVRYPEGLEVVEVDADKQPTGESTKKYANKVDFIELEYQVMKPELRQEERYVGKNRSFLVPLTQFLAAVGIPPEQPIVINDDFLAELHGKQFYVDIGRRPINVLDAETGKWSATGEFKNTHRAFQSA